MINLAYIIQSENLRFQIIYKYGLEFCIIRIKDFYIRYKTYTYYYKL